LLYIQFFLVYLVSFWLGVPDSKGGRLQHASLSGTEIFLISSGFDDLLCVWLNDFVADGQHIFLFFFPKEKGGVCTIPGDSDMLRYFAVWGIMIPIVMFLHYLYVDVH